MWIKSQCINVVLNKYNFYNYIDVNVSQSKNNIDLLNKNQNKKAMVVKMTQSFLNKRKDSVKKQETVDSRL